MDVAGKIHLDCWDLIFLDLECQYKQKGGVQFEPPPNECSSQGAVYNFSEGIIYKHPRSHRKIKQYFVSSRADGIFYPIGHQIKLQTYFQVNRKSYIAVIALTYPNFR